MTRVSTSAEGFADAMRRRMPVSRHPRKACVLFSATRGWINDSPCGAKAGIAKSLAVCFPRRMKQFLFPLLLAFFAKSLADEAPKPPVPLYETREVHDRNGIGKFFMGREIAHVMGHQAAGWLERPEREEEERTDLLVEALKFRDGEIVADIGCGSGFISRKIAKKIGSGTVYGVDIRPEMLEPLAQRMA